MFDKLSDLRDAEEMKILPNDEEIVFVLLMFELSEKDWGEVIDGAAIRIPVMNNCDKDFHAYQDEAEDKIVSSLSVHFATSKFSTTCVFPLEATSKSLLLFVKQVFIVSESEGTESC